MYGRRPTHENEDSYRDSDLGILIELHKQLTAMHRWQHKSTPEEGEQLQQHIAHIDHLVDEINSLVPKLPSHKDMGMEEPAKTRYVAALRQARDFTIPQLQTVIDKSNAIIRFMLAARRKEDATQAADWIEEILDPQTGYKEAHNWTRGTSKAPPLPTHMWKKGKYYSHPHDMGDILLKDGGSIWTQKVGPELATKNVGNVAATHHY